MVLPKSDYEAEGLRQLSDSSFYASDCDNLQLYTKQRLRSFLEVLQKKGFITKREHRALEPPCNPCDRKFYLLPKAHKSDWSFPAMPKGRPIVSDTGSISRYCACLIEFFLAPLAQRTRSYIRDSVHLISLLDPIRVTSRTILFTMDIASLYTNIPLEDGISAVSKAFLKFPDDKRPDQTLLSMLRLLLSSNDFTFLSRRFLQLQGTAMGCAFGASYANIFLSYWEERIFSHTHAPMHWYRYIDDCFGVWNYCESDLLSFCDFVNNLHQSIRVEMVWSRSSIRFLDLDLYICDNRILYKVGFKPTDNHSILSPTSFHPSHVFRSILFAQVYRWMTHSATYADFQATKRLVQRRWMEQGYTRSKIREAVRRAFQLTHQTPSRWRTGFYPCSSSCAVCGYAELTRSVHNPYNQASFFIVHRLTCHSINVIYLITCTNCNAMYIGQTSRPLRTRIAEHLRNILTNADTSVSTHFNSSCKLQHFSFTALEHCPNTSKRLLKENRWIERLHTLQPQGLNESRNVFNRSLRLILPFSSCSNRIVSLCRRQIRDVTVSTGHTTSPNLRSLLRHRDA